MAEVTGLRNNALPYPIYGAPWGVVFPMLDADGDLVSAATTPDAEVSKNGDTFADATNEATEIATTSGVYYLDLTSGEMNADTVAIIVKTSTSGAKTTVMIFYPLEATDLPVNVTAISGDSTAADNLEAAADGTTYNLGGGAIVAASVTGAVGSIAANGITATSIAADALNAAAVKADAVTKIQTGLATPTNITAGTITTVTNLTNAPTNGDLTATMKTSVTTAATAATPTAAAVTAGVTIADATSDAVIADAVWNAATVTYGGAGSYGLLVETDLDATVSSRLATTGYTAPPTAATNADAVWDEAIAGHAGVGSTGEALAAAGSAGDPWTTALPGAYGAGSAGLLLGTTIPAAIADVPTVTEFNARTLVAASYFDPAADTVANVTTVGSVTGAVGSVTGAVGSVAGNVGGNVAGSVASVTAAVDVDGIDATTANVIADHTLRRSLATAEDSANGDALTSRSLLKAAAKQVNKLAIVGTTLTVYEADDTTALFTQALTTDAAAVPIVAADTA